MKNILRSFIFVIKTAWQLGPISVIIGLVEIIFSMLSGFTPALIALMITGVISHNLTYATLGAILLLLANGSTLIISLLGTSYRLRLRNAMNNELDVRIVKLLTETPTLDNLHNPDILDKIQAIRDRKGILGAAYAKMLDGIKLITLPVTILVVAISADWRMGLVVLAMVPYVSSSYFQISTDKKAEQEAGAPGRVSTALMNLVIEPNAASELRVFGARSFLTARLAKACNTWQRPYVRAEFLKGRIASICTILYFTVASLVLSWIIHDTLAGKVSIAVITIAITSVQQLQATAWRITYSLINLAQVSRTIGRFLWLKDYCSNAIAAHPGDIPAPQKLTRGIKLTNVSFSYPSSKTPAINQLTLDIPAGMVVAIVGENGSGKTTLANLLTGMYDLDSGTITIDDLELSELDIIDWRAHCSAAFQDHANIEVKAQESIGVGLIEKKDDPIEVKKSLARAASSDLLQVLPDGLETLLGARWEDGVGLSGGQWQRVAISRGMMRTQPLLLILDEPTSALDAATEDALFTQYAKAAKETSKNGGIALLITHRFSTVSAADLVVVLDHGKVIEKGTHAELMALNGRYRELYEIQATGYRNSPRENK